MMSKTLPQSNTELIDSIIPKLNQQLKKYSSMLRNLQDPRTGKEVKEYDKSLLPGVKKLLNQYINTLDKINPINDSEHSERINSIKLAFKNYQEVEKKIIKKEKDAEEFASKREKEAAALEEAHNVRVKKRQEAEKSASKKRKELESQQLAAQQLAVQAAREAAEGAKKRQELAAQELAAQELEAAEAAKKTQEAEIANKKIEDDRLEAALRNPELVRDLEAIKKATRKLSIEEKALLDAKKKRRRASYKKSNRGSNKKISKRY